MKLRLTKEQNRLLLEFQRRAYSFDWDDNILFMPTQIYLEKKVGESWIPVSVGTEEFREIRGSVGTKFRYVDNNPLLSFRDFRSYDSFLKDTKEALKKKSFGPSFDKFIEALVYGSDFSIITARGNPPIAIKDGIKIIIETFLTDEQKDTMMSNLHGVTLDEYLNLQDYYPVSSDAFMKEFGIESSSTDPEIAKTIALKSFVDRVVKAVEEIKDNNDYTGISIGFSDDDLGNIESAEKYIEETLKILYPDVRFLVYDTSDPKNPKKKRIIVKK
jgi:hypothetical protein